MTTADLAPATSPSHNKNLKKPDDAGHKKFLEDLNKKIDLLKKQNVSNMSSSSSSFFPPLL